MHTDNDEHTEITKAIEQKIYKISTIWLLQELTKTISACTVHNDIALWTTVLSDFIAANQIAN